VNLAFHDALIASVSFLGLARGMFSSVRSRSSRTSDTPVASELLPLRLRARLTARPPRPLPAPLREDETLSATRGAFHRWGTLTRVRESLPVS
jgi:hypothetical protein